MAFGTIEEVCGDQEFIDAKLDCNYAGFIRYALGEPTVQIGEMEHFIFTTEDGNQGFTTKDGTHFIAIKVGSVGRKEVWKPVDSAVFKTAFPDHPFNYQFEETNTEIIPIQQGLLQMLEQ